MGIVVVVAEIACLFTVSGKAMIVAITIIAVTVVVFLFVFVFVADIVSTIGGNLNSYGYK